MLSKGMHEKPIKISQVFLGSLHVAVPSPSPWWGGGEGTATRRVQLSTEHCQILLYQRHLEVGDQVTGHV